MRAPLPLLALALLPRPLLAPLTPLGKNQWARIASLMNRKSAKQCKARWYEWLDPSIRKTEWSREEEEKLLHLAKIMPTQWRTIAPLVGRTAAQCLDKYEQLLDAASTRADAEELAEARRLRPGEIDPNPEGKAARPDAVDMEEDEKEMLQEARARLANTKGKKAKRKAREKQLEEARRLASLQKRRELKAAGLGGSRRRKIKGMDYNGEVPFLHRPQAGFFSTDEERTREHMERAGTTFTPTLLTKLEGQRREQQGTERKKRDVNQLKDKIKQGESLEALAEHAQMLKRRAPLALPGPTLGDEEMRALADAMDLDPQEEDAGGATRALLAGGETPKTQALALTRPLPDRTPSRSEALRAEAAHLAALRGAATPLLAEEGTPRLIPPTPLRAAPAPTTTPATPARTPRDALRINPEEAPPTLLPDLRAGLAALPKPREYRLALPEDAMDLEAPLAPSRPSGPRDQADVDADGRRAQAAQAAEVERRRSQAKQRGLPLPARPSPQFSRPLAEGAEETERAQELLHAEMLRVRESDSLADPPAEFSEGELRAARSLLEAEVAALTAEQGTITPSAHATTWEACWADLLPLPAPLHKVTRRTLASEAEHVRALQAEHAALHVEHQAQAKRLGAAERRLDVLHRGYRAVAGKKEHEVAALHDQLGERRVQGKVFAALRQLEQGAAPVRLDTLQTEVEAQRAREADLQARYADLTRTKQSLLEGAK